MSERDPLPPAMGERRAIGGYHPQYRVAAGLIIRALRNGTLEWIRVADPEAGRVDDLQIGAGGLLDAYQVKWSRFPETFTFNDLVKPSNDRPSLIRQLADGWQRLRAANPARRVTVHLVTDDFASTHDRPPDAAQPHTADHFASFLAEAWEPRSQQPDQQIPVRWRRAWELLVEASGLSPDDFDAFVSSCRLDLAYRLTYDVDGVKLTESDVTRRADSVDSVRSLLRALKTSFHSWERALKPLAARASEQEIFQLAELFAESERSSMVLSLLASRLAKLGRPREAIELGEQAFKQTQPSGWHQYWDGGSRIRALESLALVDRQRAEQLGLDTLIDELASGTADGGPLAVELIRILPLLTGTLPAARIWGEITWFLEALFAHAGPLERPRLAPPEAAGREQATAIGAWVLEYLDHPANALSRSAQRAVIELLDHRG